MHHQTCKVLYNQSIVQISEKPRGTFCLSFSLCFLALSPAHSADRVVWFTLRGWGRLFGHCAPILLAYLFFFLFLFLLLCFDQTAGQAQPPNPGAWALIDAGSNSTLNGRIWGRMGGPAPGSVRLVRLTRAKVEARWITEAAMLVLAPNPALHVGLKTLHGVGLVKAASRSPGQASAPQYRDNGPAADSPHSPLCRN